MSETVPVCKVYVEVLCPNQKCGKFFATDYQRLAIIEHEARAFIGCPHCGTEIKIKFVVEADNG